MEAISKHRSVNRRIFTKTCNELEAILLKSDEPDFSATNRAKFNYLKEVHNKLMQLDEDVKSFLLKNPDTSEKQLEDEIESAQQYHQRWLLIEEIKKSREIETKNIKMPDPKRNFKLPQLELKKFDGKLVNWLQFWGQFHKIDLDESIDPVDKFQYLIQSTAPGSEVRGFVESFPPSEESYVECIQELKSRYARNDVLTQIYVRELLNIILSKDHQEQNLTILYDKLNTQLRALHSLGVTHDKYAAFLLPMVESAVPADVLKAWERAKNKDTKDELGDLLEFLKKEVESEQRIQMAQDSFQGISLKQKEEKVGKQLNIEKESTAECLVATEKLKQKCVWCDKDNHNSSECYKMYKMTVQQRKQCLKDKKACIICFKNHFYKNCKAFVKCLICQKRHHTILCPDQNTTEDGKGKGTPTTVNASSATSSTLLQTVMVEIEHQGKKIRVRAMYDSGSQRTYVKQDVVDKLSIPEASTEVLSHSLFGGVETKSQELKLYNLNVKSLDHTFEIEMVALSQKCICSNVPKINFNDKKLVKLLNENKIQLTDKGESSEIGLLIGADFSGFLSTGTIVQLNNGLVAFKTRLGWTLQGKQVGVYMNNPITTALTCINNDSLAGYWSLETLGIQDPAEVKSKETQEAEVLTSFEETITINSDGRYEVQLPFKAGHEDILTNYEIAKSRLDSITKKLMTCGKLDEYHTVFKEWQTLGIIERVPVSEIQHDKGHYLPHRPVIKESSLTSTIRPVFDASATDKNGLSLNKCLEKGCNFIDRIPKLLIGFRQGAIGITSDIAKAFLQISLQAQDRQYLKFLWWEDELFRKTVEYRHCRVVFGLTSSPFLLSATLMHHLDRISGEHRETAQLLKKSFYVDNCLTSLESETETCKFIQESKEIMKAAKFDLRMWTTSPLPINETGKEVVTVLGMNWDTKSDELSCNTVSLPACESLQHITNRELLSITQRVFDPIGILTAVMLVPKVILQEICLRKLSWDQEIPLDLLNKFKEWYKYISNIKECKIPRRLTATNIKESELSLHLFADASKVGYAACVLLRAEKDENVTVQLISAKARVTPPKNTSIPRLELLAALIGSRLLGEVKKNTYFENSKTYCWTDSSVVLCWIQRELPLNNFVGNRVREIRQHTNINDWHHIPGAENWADLASRGCTAKDLLECRWWQGPSWLWSAPEDWPRSEMVVDEQQVNLETKKVVCTICPTESLLDRVQRYFSKYTKLIRSVAWILRFINNILHKNNKKKGEITYKEYEKAEKKVIKLIQESSKEDLQRQSGNITMFDDEEGLKRIKTKLTLSDFPENTRTPYLLPAKHPLVRLLVRHRHEQLQHAGVDQLIVELRARFWIIGIRRLVKSVIADCIVCKRYRSKSVQAPTAPLPTERIISSAPFQNTGVDLAGPLFLRNGEKCWIVLYTCAVYRAVHLELTRSLSTEAFIMTMRRFIARRGRAELMLSDQGTNFHRTKSLLSSLDWEEIQRHSSIRQIQWRMNAPTAAWWGGFWERLIRIVKELLRRIIGKASLTYDELETILCECEAVMNGRPLTYVNSDKGESLEPLTPAHFIYPARTPVTEVSDLDQIDNNSLNNRLKYIQKVRDQFKERFRNEYLTFLVQKGRQNQDEIKEGDIVLVESGEKRIKWPLGIVQKLFPGRDGVQRSAEVRTAVGTKVRPVQRLYRLEISSEQSTGDEYSIPINKTSRSTTDQTDQSVNKTAEQGSVNTQSRCGRQIKVPTLAHRAKSTQYWLAAREIDFIRHEDWPSYSPDLSPLDYKIWQHLEATGRAD